GFRNVRSTLQSACRLFWRGSPSTSPFSRQTRIPCPCTHCPRLVVSGVGRTDVRRNAMPFRVLDATVAAQIAAGEVVERPASVVKELVENALDAGARRISVSVRGGGIEELMIQDDGGGIPADQIEVAFARHATSKLTTADDLWAIQTLGFRGEALPSIAAIAQVSCVSRVAAAAIGAELRIAGGEVQSFTA